MHKVIARTFVMAVLLTWAASAAFAQAELGTITGTIKDAQGAVLPGVTATAVNAETNVTTTAVTNDQGVYLLIVAGQRPLQGHLHARQFRAGGAGDRGPRRATACASTSRCELGRDDRRSAGRRRDAAAPDDDRDAQPA